jgi:regulator of replication initiation timing
MKPNLAEIARIISPGLSELHTQVLLLCVDFPFFFPFHVFLSVCLECRMLPSRIKNIESILSKFVSKYEETELKLAEKITETAHLQDENIRLRQRLNTNEKENRSLEQDLLGETMKTNTEELREQNHSTVITSYL